jgi:hypothetical protein
VHVHDQHLRPQATAELQGLLAVGRFCDHLEVSFTVEQLSKGGEKEWVVISNHNACRTAALRLALWLTTV